MSRREMTQVTKLIKNQKKIYKKSQSIQPNRNASTIKTMILRELKNPEHDNDALEEMHSELRMIKKIDKLFQFGKNKDWFYKDLQQNLMGQSIYNLDLGNKLEENRRSHAVEPNNHATLIEEPKVTFKVQTPNEVLQPEQIESPKIIHKMSDTSSKPMNLLNKLPFSTQSQFEDIPQHRQVIHK